MNISLPLHHAVLVVSPDRHTTYTALQSDFPSPTHKHIDQTVLDIDTARDIISWAKSAIQGDEHGNRALVLSFHTITHPAQNALLKILEEPQSGVRFIFVTSSKDRLLDTVLSRMHVVHHGESTASLDAIDFLQAAPVSRIKLPYITQLLNREDEEGRKDREAVKGFILSLVEVLRKENASPRYTQETLAMASYAGDPSASGKALIEYLALLLPKQKN